MSLNPADLSSQSFQSPPRSNKKNLDESNISHDNSAARQFLRITSPGRDKNQGVNSSLLSALFPNGGSPIRNDRSQSPYRQRSGSHFNNEHDFKEQTSQVLADQGYNEDEVKTIQSNMIVYKSISAVKEYREYMKDKMRKARDYQHIKAKVSTVNKGYQKRKQSGSRSSRNDIKLQDSITSPSRALQSSSNLSKVNLTSTNARSQKILEIENILLKNSQPYEYSKKPETDLSSLRFSQTMGGHSNLLASSIQRNHQNLQYSNKVTDNQTIESIGSYTKTPNDLMKELQSPQIQSYIHDQQTNSIEKKEERTQNIEDEETSAFNNNNVGPSPVKSHLIDDALTVEDLKPIAAPQPIQQSQLNPSKQYPQQIVKKNNSKSASKQFAQPKFTPAPEKQPEQQNQPEQQRQPDLEIQQQPIQQKTMNKTTVQSKKVEPLKSKFSPMKQRSIKASSSNALSPAKKSFISPQAQTQKSVTMKSATPQRRGSKVGKVSAGLKSPQTLTDRQQPQKHSQTFQANEKLQLTSEDQFLENGCSDQKTTMQSPGSSNVQKQSYMGSSSTSFFRSPNQRTQTSYKSGVNNLAFKNELATSEDLNNRDNSNIDEIDEISQSQFYVEKTFDAKSFIENYTITYQRKKDDEVQALLEEFYNMRKLECKPEHPEKWMKRGDSPTKRLIQMKKAAHIHQPSIKEIRKGPTKSSNGYTIKYVASPKKSYLVNPIEGEIDYSDAYKNFDKFYARVSKQEIVKYRIVEDELRKNENKDDKWFKTPNNVQETTRPRFKVGKDQSKREQVMIGGKHE